MMSLNIAACWCFVRWSIEIINNISFLNRNVERITMIILKKIMSHCLETKLNAFMQTYARYVTAVVRICSLSKHWHTDSSLSDSYRDLGPCEAGDPCDNGSVFGKKKEPKYIYSWVPVPMWERLCRSTLWGQRQWVQFQPLLAWILLWQWVHSVTVILVQ